MKEIKRAVLIFVVFFLVTGLVYPLVMAGISNVVFKSKANGSLIINSNVIEGSYLIGQQFTGYNYFHGRPSFGKYNMLKDGSSNLAPSTKIFISTVKQRIKKIRLLNGLSSKTKIPAGAVMESGSGLSPYISLKYAMLQANRVAVARQLNTNTVKTLIKSLAFKREFGLYGKQIVNFVKLNIALNKLSN